MAGMTPVSSLRPKAQALSSSGPRPKAQALSSVVRVASPRPLCAVGLRLCRVRGA